MRLRKVACSLPDHQKTVVEPIFTVVVLAD
jgi:hypothetical protein